MVYFNVNRWQQSLSAHDVTLKYGGTKHWSLQLFIIWVNQSFNPICYLLHWMVFCALHLLNKVVPNKPILSMFFSVFIGKRNLKMHFRNAYHVMCYIVMVLFKKCDWYSKNTHFINNYDYTNSDIKDLRV